MDSRTRTSTSTTSALGTRANARRRELEHSGLVWLDVVQPTALDVAYLRDRFSFDALALDDIVAVTQRPKLVHIKDQYLFIVLHIPSLDRDDQVVTSEVDLFVGRDFVVSLHEGNLRPLRRLFAAAGSDESARSQLMGRGAGYLLYRIIDNLLTNQCFPLLDRVNEDLERLNRRLLQRDTHLIGDLTALRRDVITLHHIFGPDVIVAEALRDLDTTLLRLDTARYFGECASDVRRLHDISDEQQHVVGALSAALDNLNVQRTNHVLRMLVYLTIFLLPLALLAALAGLNAVVPFREQPLIFTAIVLIVGAATSGLLVYLRFRNWP